MNTCTRRSAAGESPPRKVRSSWLETRAAPATFVGVEHLLFLKARGRGHERRIDASSRAEYDLSNRPPSSRSGPQMCSIHLPRVARELDSRSACRSRVAAEHTRPAAAINRRDHSASQLMQDAPHRFRRPMPVPKQQQRHARQVSALERKHFRAATSSNVFDAS